VRAKPLTAAQLQNISETQAQLKIELGDTDAAKQVLVATNDQIVSVTGESKLRWTHTSSLFSKPKKGVPIDNFVYD
jgi:hypothetical protein